MKRPLSFLLAVCVVAAVAGWVAAQARNLYREHETAEKAEQARLVAEADAKKLAGKIAGLAREADEVVISWFGIAGGKGEREIRLSDAAWQARFASVLANATFTPTTSHALWTSEPMITFYREKVDLLFLQPGGRRVIAHGERGSAEFLMPHPAADAILTLVHEKDSDGSVPTDIAPAAVKPTGDASIAPPPSAAHP